MSARLFVPLGSVVHVPRRTVSSFIPKLPRMEPAKPVLVVGATGSLGFEICRQLVAAKKAVTALVRTTSAAEQVQTLQSWGIKTVTGDLKNRASLDGACTGVSAVISTATCTLSRREGDNIDTVDRMGQYHLLEAALAARVQQFVYISVLPSAEDFPLQDAKRAVEKRLRTSGITYTVFRPAFFMEMWLGPHLGFEPDRNTATIYGSGLNAISWIATKDVAAFVVAALDNDVAHNRTIELGGPEAISPLDVVHLFEARKGRTFQLQHVPERGLRVQLENADDPLLQSFAALMLMYAAGADVPMQETAQQFGINLSSISDYCNQVLGLKAVEKSF